MSHTTGGVGHQYATIDLPVLGALLAAQAGEGVGYLITGDKDLIGHWLRVTPSSRLRCSWWHMVGWVEKPPICLGLG